MEIGNKILKMNWKYRIRFAIGIAITYSFILWLFDYFSEDTIPSVKSILFQGITFGLFFGIGFPYFNENLLLKFLIKLE
ncbi:MAG: hypothetical protein BM564_01700 [Bacteroidetes bacterium MedPE-SWsnd-G2]|nr:MAG: hypothetical protein BM564_01700 [Bacteroidetes bacterium MedPE-SWsnd-G2]